MIQWTQDTVDGSETVVASERAVERRGVTMGPEIAGSFGRPEGVSEADYRMALVRGGCQEI